MKSLHLLFVILFTTFSQQLSSQQINTKKLDQYFDSLRVYDKWMGGAALLKNGEIIYSRNIGYSDIENKIEANTSTKYRIGSISKTFTTVLIFKVVESQKLKLTQTVSDFLPNFPKGNLVTISQLLNHHSGIHNFTNDKAYQDYFTKPKSREKLLKVISDGGYDFEPGAKAEYSNSNFVLLTVILENIYNKTYADLLDSEIIKPLGLKNTTYGSAISIKNNEAYSYRFIGDWIKEDETDMSIPLGAGAIISTPTDLCLFAEALFNNKILSAESVSQMKTLEDNYGMGLFTFPFQDKTAYGHNGGIDGFQSTFGYIPTDNIAIAVITNGASFDLNEVALALLNAAFDNEINLPSSAKSIEVDEAILEDYTGVYASSEIPLKITITHKNGRLIGQGTGQAPFTLNTRDSQTFEFTPGGIVLSFPDQDKMILSQGGVDLTFIKE